MPISKTESLNSSKLNFSSAEIGDEEELATPVPPVKKSSSGTKNSKFKAPQKKSQKEIAKLLGTVPKLSEVFSLTGKVGEGTFSSVFLAEVKKNPEIPQKFVLKHITPTSHPDRIITELRCLQIIGGSANVMGIECCLRERDHVVMVMKYFPHQKFQDYVGLMTVEETREYMKNLFIALQQVHKFQVIHRDVKPSNFLYNRKEKKYALVDFGLAQKVPSLSKPNKAIPEKKNQKDKEESQERRQKDQEVSQKSQDGKSQKENVDQTKTPPTKTAPIILRGSKRKHHSIESQHLNAGRNLEKSKCRPSPGLAELDINTFSNGGSKTPRFIQANPLNDSTEIMQRSKRARYTSLEGLQKVVKPLNEDIIVRQKTKALTNVRTERVKCRCYGLPQVCSVCTSRPNQVAPRAGTPGFRSPEVLLKYQDQTTGVDMWAAGVIFLSILSGRYPFFRAHDDLTALAQIMSILGTENTKETAKKLGKNLLCNVNIKPMKLKNMCERLRGGKVRKSSPRLQNLSKRKSPNQNADQETTLTERKNLNKENQSLSLTINTKYTTPEQKRLNFKTIDTETVQVYPDSAYDLLERLLDLDPSTRLSATEALKHPFILNLDHR